MKLDRLKIITQFWLHSSSKTQITIFFGGIALIFVLFIFIWLAPEINRYYYLNNNLNKQQETFIWVGKSSKKIIENGLNNKDTKDFKSRISSVFTKNNVIDEIQITIVNNNRAEIIGEFVKFSDLYKALFYLENRWSLTVEKLRIKYVEGDRVSLKLNIINSI